MVSYYNAPAWSVPPSLWVAADTPGVPVTCWTSVQGCEPAPPRGCTGWSPSPLHHCMHEKRNKMDDWCSRRRFEWRIRQSRHNSFWITQLHWLGKTGLGQLTVAQKHLILSLLLFRFCTNSDVEYYKMVKLWRCVLLTRTIGHYWNICFCPVYLKSPAIATANNEPESEFNNICQWTVCLGVMVGRNMFSLVVYFQAARIGIKGHVKQVYPKKDCRANSWIVMNI